jgi:hypothetical protein
MWLQATESDFYHHKHIPRAMGCFSERSVKLFTKIFCSLHLSRRNQPLPDAVCLSFVRMRFVSHHLFTTVSIFTPRRLHWAIFVLCSIAVFSQMAQLCTHDNSNAPKARLDMRIIRCELVSLMYRCTGQLGVGNGAYSRRGLKDILYDSICLTVLHESIDAKLVRRRDKFFLDFQHQRGAAWPVMGRMTLAITPRA